ncbi:MAG: hypothetical protein LBR19_08620, partial [Bifidobacteriaceae bacterium]|jgi:hypothetical protein|nr:hypothetical protein [Bifidobacteriaceae bacterium]
VAGPATSNTYVVKAEDAGKALWVRAKATADNYLTGFAQTGPLPQVPPLSLGSVAVTGTAAVGGRLEATLNGLAPADATVAYQWFRGTSTIAGATTGIYTLMAADAGRDIVLKVTVSKPGLTAVTKYSNHVQVLGITRAEVAGVPAVGSTLQVGVDYLPATAGLAYQWFRGTAAIAGATRAAYTLAAADAGRDLVVKVTASVPGLTAVTKYSNHVQVLGITRAEVAGVPAVGSTLQVGVDYLPATASLTYQWFRGTSAVKGATQATYTLTAADAGQDLVVKVTVSLDGVGSQVKYSNHVLVPAGVS